MSFAVYTANQGSYLQPARSALSASYTFFGYTHQELVMLCIRKDCVRNGAQYRIVVSRTGEQWQVVLHINEGCTDRNRARGFLDSPADVASTVL